MFEFDINDYDTAYDRFLWSLEDLINDPDAHVDMERALDLAYEFGIFPEDQFHFEAELERRFPELSEA